MSDTTVTLFVIIYLLFSFCVFNWWIRARFIAEGFIHSGSWMRLKKAYKERWSLLKRLVLIPLFSHDSTEKYHILGVLNYCQLFLTFFCICVQIFFRMNKGYETFLSRGLIVQGIIVLIQYIVINDFK